VATVGAIEAIKGRRSVRRYLPDPVPREVIEDIVNCGDWRRRPAMISPGSSWS